MSEQLHGFSYQLRLNHDTNPHPIPHAQDNNTKLVYIHTHVCTDTLSRNNHFFFGLMRYWKSPWGSEHWLLFIIYLSTLAYLNIPTYK